MRGIRQGQVEVVIEVSRKDCVLNDILTGYNCLIERLAMGPKITLHKVLFNGDEREIMRKVAAIHVNSRKAGPGALWVESSSCTPCAFFASPFSNVLGSRALCDNRIQYRVLLPSIKDLRALEIRMKKAEIDYMIIGILPYLHQELTERQREILKMALENGYFADDSRTSLSDLADIIGISPSSLSEILRRSLKKSVNFYFDHRP